MPEEKCMDRLRAAAPAPHDETLEYSRFSYTFPLYFAVFVVGATYISCLFDFFGEDGVLWVSKNLPILGPRISFLSSVDQSSYLAFGATVLTCLICLPIVFSVWLVGYWKTVVSQRKCRGLSLETIYSVSFMIFVSGCLVAIAFAHVPDAFEVSRPGMSRILFWPFFPLVGATVTWLSAMTLFSISVGLMKLIMALRGSDG